MKIEVEKTHALSAELVVQRIDQQIDAAKEKFGSNADSVEYEWSDRILSAKVRALGMACEARTTVHSNKVSVKIDGPFALLPFKSKIEQMIMFRLNKVCAPEGS